MGRGDGNQQRGVKVPLGSKRVDHGVLEAGSSSKQQQQQQQQVGGRREQLKIAGFHSTQISVDDTFGDKAESRTLCAKDSTAAAGYRPRQ